MFAFVAVHDDTALGLQFPRSLIDVEHDDVHAEIHGRLLGGQTGAQAVVEENQQGRLVAAEVLVLKTVVFDVLGFAQCSGEVAEVVYVLKNFHVYFFFLPFFFFSNCP